MSASEESARLWAHIAQTDAMVIISRGPAGWQLTAGVGRRNSIATGNANTAAGVARILRNVMPELFGNHALFDNHAVQPEDDL